MSWTDDFAAEHNLRRNIDFHRSGFTAGQWVDWLIERGDIITLPEHERRVENLHRVIRQEREQHQRERAAIGDSVDATVRENAAIVHAVTQLVDVRRKTLRMDDLLHALGWDDVSGNPTLQDLATAMERGKEAS